MVGRRPFAAEDVGWLWRAHAASEVGSGVGIGTIPLVAILVLHADAWQVSVLAALGGIGAAVTAFSLSSTLDRHRRRPVMMLADMTRAVTLVSVPVAWLADALTFAHLCVVGIVSAAASLLFSAAAGAHVQWLVEDGRRLEVSSRFESTTWMANTVGPPIGGALATAFGAVWTLAIDAASYVASALCLARIDRPEVVDAAPPTSGRSAFAGWHVIRRHRGLLRLYVNAMMFGAALMMASPLQSVLMFDELHLAAWQYGIVVGVPAIGGFLGAAMAPRLAGRIGEHNLLLASGSLRTVWLALVALAPSGWAGFVIVLGADFALLMCAGMFNPLFATYRMRHTPNSHMARVLATWSASSRLVQPAGMLLGGALTQVLSLRGVIGAAAGLLVLSTLALPWREALAGPEA